MKLLGKILVPVDVTSNSTGQINATIKLATEFNSEVFLLYVIPDEELHAELKKIVLKEVSESLDEIRKTLIEAKVNVREPLIATGRVVSTIASTANTEDVNVIIIGSNTKTGNSNYKLSGKAEQIMRMSDVPVFLVKPENRVLFSNIMCPVDFSGPSRRALNNAIMLARQYRSSLSVLTVYEPLTHVPKRLSIDLENENALRLKRVRKEMESFINEFDLNGIDHKIEIRAGKIHEVILEEAEVQNIDLLIMGTNGRTGLSWFFMGSVTEKVIREMPCSIITIKRVDVIRPKLDYEIKEIEVHYKNGEELIKNGSYEEAINQFKMCLQVNDMHIPSINKLAEIHDKLGNIEKSLYYKDIARDILIKTWDKKIEEDIRKHYGFK